MRERILASAIELFAQRGYAATSMSEVCEHAGVGKPAVYWHFKNKEGLLGAALQAVRGQWIEHIQKRVQAGGGDPRERLRRFTDIWRDIVIDAPHALRLPMIVELENANSSLAGEARKAIGGIWERAERTLVDGFRNSGYDVPDLDLIAHTAVTLLQGAMIRQIVTPDVRQLDRVLVEFRNTIVLLLWSRFPLESRKSAVEFLNLEKPPPT